MPKFVIELDVEMEDGSTFSVVADQRDVARWEVQPFGCPAGEMDDSPSVTFLRFLAWSAAFRQQVTALKWDAFDAQCVEAMPPDDEEGEGSAPADAEDPGRSAPSASRTSRSRDRAAKR